MMRLREDYVSDSIQLIKETVTADQFDMLQRYVEMIIQWNQKTNITSKHNIESRIYDFICEAVALTQLFYDRSVTIADVGSGAGFPGLVLNLLGYKHCLLIEVNVKKAAFLQHVIAELNLTAKVSNKDVRQTCLNELDYIVSKAVTNIDALLEMCEGITAKRTKFILCRNNTNGKTRAMLRTISIGSKVFKFVEYPNKF